MKFMLGVNRLAIGLHVLHIIKRTARYFGGLAKLFAVFIPQIVLTIVASQFAKDKTETIREIFGPRKYLAIR